jgi:taurine dioxygenase
MSGITVTPLTTTIGARLEGIDLRQPISAADAQVIRKALADHFVITFRDQPINLDQQKALAGIFGPLEAVAAHKLVGDDNPVTVLDNESYKVIDADRLQDTFLFRDEFQEWHVDSAFSAEIPSVACLRAEVIPPVGGDTCWAGMAAAYDHLSETMKEWVEKLSVIFSPPPGYRGYLRLKSMPQGVQDEWEKQNGARLHPLVTRHPVSGRKMLYVNPAYAVKVHTLSNSESAWLLRFLHSHCTRPDFVYRHHWSVGDVMIWDELATTHLAPKDYFPHERRVVRVFAGMTAPTAARAAGAPSRQAAQ